MKKFELTNKSIKLENEHFGWCNGEVLYRIKALIDFSDVKAGDLGGFVGFEEQLSQEGNCWIYDNAMVFGCAKVSGNSYISECSKIYGYAKISENAKVSGNSEIYGCSKIYGHAKISENAKVYGFSEVCGYSNIFGDDEICLSSTEHNIAKIIFGEKFPEYHSKINNVSK